MNPFTFCGHHVWRLIWPSAGLCGVCLSVVVQTAISQESAPENQSPDTGSLPVILIAQGTHNPAPEDVVMIDLTAFPSFQVPTNRTLVITDILYSSEVDFVLQSSRNFPNVRSDLRLSATSAVSASGSITTPGEFVFDNVTVPGTGNAASSLTVDLGGTTAKHIQSLNLKTGIPYPSGARISVSASGSASGNPNVATIIGYLKPLEPVFLKSEVEEALRKLSRPKEIDPSE